MRKELSMFARNLSSWMLVFRSTPEKQHNKKRSFLHFLCRAGLCHMQLYYCEVKWPFNPIAWSSDTLNYCSMLKNHNTQDIMLPGIFLYFSNIIQEDQISQDVMHYLSPLVHSVLFFSRSFRLWKDPERAGWVWEGIMCWLFQKQRSIGVQDWIASYLFEQILELLSRDQTVKEV